MSEDSNEMEIKSWRCIHRYVQVEKRKASSLRGFYVDLD